MNAKSTTFSQRQKLVLMIKQYLKTLLNISTYTEVLED